MRILFNIQKLSMIGLFLFFIISCTKAHKPDRIDIQTSELESRPVLKADTSNTQRLDSLGVVSGSSITESLINKTVSDSGMTILNPDSMDSLYRYDSTMAQIEFRKVENNAFQIGEYLEFQIGWKLFKAGTATMSVGDTVWQNGRSCYHIQTTANSSSVIDVFYKVRDKVESIIDKDGMFPWRFEKHLREGKFRRDRYTTFDPYQKMAFVKKDTVHIPPYVQDILSSFYYVRTLPLEVGKYFDVDNITDKKVYPLRVLVHKKERVKVPAGKFNCIVVEPVLRGEGLFNQKGRLTIWLTDDARKMPVMMKSEVFIGTVDIKLKKYKNTIKS